MSTSVRARVAWAMLGASVLAVVWWAVVNQLQWMLIGSYSGGFLWFEVSGASPSNVILLIVLTLGLAALAAWPFRRMLIWALRPLPTITTAVAHLGPQNLGQRIRYESGRGDPLKQLADTIDDVLERLAAGFDGQRRFAANASHELRTPLAVQRMLIELALESNQKNAELQRLGAQLLLTNVRNERLIEGLLVLAESDRGLAGHVPVRVDELVIAVLEAHEDLAKQHEVTLEREGIELTVPGDPVLLERLITNLVQNAIKYNRPDGTVKVLVENGTLTVRNTGERVPPEAIPGLFEPFRRLTRDRTASRDGAGLGLSIVRSIATAHGGTAIAEPGIDGGLSVRITLPLPTTSLAAS